MKIRKNAYCFVFLYCVLFLLSCNNQEKRAPVESPTYILSSFMNFWNYWYNNVKLPLDFIAFDQNGEQINKQTFLKDLSSGKYLPLRLKSKHHLFYQLYKIPKPVPAGIQNTIVMLGEYGYYYFEMIGKPLPEFDFIDIKGNHYNMKTCRGKTVILNCWFIGCHACIKEIPALNKLVDSYKNKDIVFLGLAMDSSRNIEKFLANETFKYAVVPNMRNYLSNVLRIPQYPTQIIINKNGLVINAMSDYHMMEYILKKRFSKWNKGRKLFVIQLIERINDIL